MLLASTADWVEIFCNCKKQCVKTYRYQKKNIPCFIYCHAKEDLDCGNLSRLKERTQHALINRDTVSLPTRKRVQASTVMASTPATKKPRAPKETKISRQTRAQTQQRQITLLQYEGMQPIVNRLAGLGTKKAPAQASSSSSLSDLDNSC